MHDGIAVYHKTKADDQPVVPRFALTLCCAGGSSQVQNVMRRPESERACAWQYSYREPCCEEMIAYVVEKFGLGQKIYTGDDFLSCVS
jgi:hypothetical protein